MIKQKKRKIRINFSKKRSGIFSNPTCSTFLRIKNSRFIGVLSFSLVSLISPKHQRKSSDRFFHPHFHSIKNFQKTPKKRDFISTKGLEISRRIILIEQDSEERSFLQKKQAPCYEQHKFIRIFKKIVKNRVFRRKFADFWSVSSLPISLIGPKTGPPIFNKNFGLYMSSI